MKGESPDPEWVRVPEAGRMFSLSVTHLYDLMRENAIKHTSLRRPGNTRGIRLIYAPSVRALLEANANTVATLS